MKRGAFSNRLLQKLRQFRALNPPPPADAKIPQREIHNAHAAKINDAVNADPKLSAFVRELKKREFEQ